MNKILRLDFETRGTAELSGKNSVGLYNYANHPETKVLMLAWKFDTKEPLLWQPHLLDTMPPTLYKALQDPEVTVSAFNSAFERYILQYKLGVIIPASRFLDPQVGARYLSMPANLESVCEILDLPPNLQKDKRGAALIDLFSEPKTRKKKEGGGIYFNDWNSHPKEWEEFCNYCVRDVVAEEEVARRMGILGALPLPPFEQKLWIFDQTVNDRGMPTDRVFVEKMYRLALRSKAEAKENFEKLTGVENANSPAQIKTWAKTQGYPYPSLSKDVVASALKDPNLKLTDLCRKALEMRKEAASTSYQKLRKILLCISPDGRLPGQFVFMGSSRCGRWSGNNVQIHNFARPAVVGGHDFEDMKVVKEARAMIQAEDYEGIKATYGSVLLVVKSLIRTVFVAPREA